MLGAYLLEDLVAIGGTKLLPNVGEVGLDWVDVWHYHQATDRLPKARERIMLKQLCDAYAYGKLQGTDPLSISPAIRTED